MARLHIIIVKTLVGLMLSLADSAARGDDVTAEPEPGKIAAAGRTTAGRFASESASWTATTSSGTDLSFVVDVVASPRMRRWVISVEARGQRQEFARGIERDGVWYVAQGAKGGKYRPYEAPIDVATAYLYLIRADLQVVSQEAAGRLGVYESTTDGIATYRTPLAEGPKSQLQKVIAAFDEMKRKNPGQTINAETSRVIEQSRELLSKGIALKIEIKSGLIIQYGAPERRTTIKRFRWLDRVDPREFAIDGRKWDDFTDDPTRGSRDELLMIGHNGVWRPGMRSPEMDGRLLDMKTGRIRRIPFRGVVSEPGCFLKDRNAVVIAGMDPDAGALGLFEVNLSTGANRPLGGPLLATGFTLFPQLSPDGKTVVAVHSGGQQSILSMHVCLVDLETGTARLIGEAGDRGPTSWMPDGKALLTVDREGVEPTKPTKNTICRMDLDGRLTRLRPGSNPVIVGNPARILFEDAERTWQTCDLSGNDVRVYAGGMKGHAFPAPSPDGKRLLMMSFQSGRAPAPMIFTLGDSQGTPATTLPGLWGHPGWR